MESYSVPFRTDSASPQGVMATLRMEKCFLKNECTFLVITYRICVTFSVEAQAKLSQLVTKLLLIPTFARKERGLRAPKGIAWVLL